MNNIAINNATIQSWIDNRLTIESVEQFLISNGYETVQIQEYIQQFKKIKNSKKLITGIIIMGIGAFMGFLACVIAMINPIPDIQDFFLFGLTLVAIGLMIYGMYLVF